MFRQRMILTGQPFSTHKGRIRKHKWQPQNILKYSTSDLVDEFDYLTEAQANKLVNSSLDALRKYRDFLDALDSSRVLQPGEIRKILITSLSRSIAN